MLIHYEKLQSIENVMFSPVESMWHQEYIQKAVHINKCWVAKEPREEGTAKVSCTKSGLERSTNSIVPFYKNMIFL